MCLYPRYIRNRKYMANKKNGGNVPPLSDERILYVPVGCGKCMECLKQKQREWSVRLSEEIRHDRTGKFVTLTFSNKSMKQLGKLVEPYAKGYIRDNLIATVGMRRYLERWRKKHKKSVKHWFITEWGQNNTERMHMHGIMFTDEIEDIKSIWKYGGVFIGEYVNERSVNYIVKYLGKYDEKHPEYIGKILTSAGIGRKYTDRIDSKLNKYKKGETKEYYKTRTGHKLSLPIYYRNKIYSEEERERLWIEKLDRAEIYVMGEKIRIDSEEGQKEYDETLKYYQEKNNRMGYGNNSVDWNKKEYMYKKNRIKHITEGMNRMKEAERAQALVVSELRIESAALTSILNSRQNEQEVKE